VSDKIGVLFLQAQEGFGADSAIHAHIMRYLDRSKFEVHVACTGGAGDGEPPSLRVLKQIPELRVRVTHFAPSLSGRTLGGLSHALGAARGFSRDLLDLRRYIKTNKIRLLHSSDRPRDAAYCVALGKLTGTKSVVHVHVKWSNEYSAPARWAVQHADAVFSISRYVTDTIVAMGRPAEHIYTVLNAIDAARWDPTTDGSAFRRELRIPESAPLLASVSRLFSWKGQRELIQAFALARAELPELRLVVVGADAPHVHGASFTDELKQLARSLGVHEHVTFTGARSDIPAVMAACDVFTLPSFEEPFGLVFLEAMAMQRPVVAIANGGTPEVVEHGVTGLLSPPWDIPELARNITSLVRDPERRRSFGSAGRARLLERFDAPRMAQDAAAAYQTLLGA
jgi:glycosyltransferase involved in cell wall biosynthesis